MTKNRNRCLRGALTLAVLTLGVGACTTSSPGTFETSAQAVQALAELINSGDSARAAEMFGPGYAEMLGSGDEVADKQDAAKVKEMIQEQVAFEDAEGNRVVALLGKDAWPFAIPLVRQGKRWRFDTAAGQGEILNRRIGRNELLTLATLHAYVEAQREYHLEGRDDNRPAYAQSFRSDEGLHNGLFWPAAAGDPESPLGDLAAKAAAEGYVRHEDGAPDPYHGYLFRILPAQGKGAPGGERTYIDAKGLMTAGFGAIAWPVEYGKSGVMTFIVNQQGIVFQKDLGQATGMAVEGIVAYDPDETWSPTGD